MSAPIISTGDILPNDYRYEGIPDGIGILSTSKGGGVILVSPRDLDRAIAGELGQPGAAADFHNAEISELQLSQASGGVLAGGWTGHRHWATSALARAFWLAPSTVLRSRSTSPASRAAMLSRLLAERPGRPGLWPPSRR